MKSLCQNKRGFRITPSSILISVLTFLHLGFITIFDKVTAFAPDELNYIGVFRNLYKSDFSLEGYSGWQEGSINALRVIYLPAKILNLIGFSEFYAVRLLSIFCSMFSLYLLMKMQPGETLLKRNTSFWLAGAYFIPTFFLWGSLGLRESFIFLSLIAVFYAISNPKNLNSKLQYTLITISGIFLLISKNYLYALLLICFITSMIILFILRRKSATESIKFLSAFLIPLFLFPSIASNIAFGAIRIEEVRSSTPPPTIYSEGQTLHDLIRQLDKNEILSKFASGTKVGRELTQQKKSSNLSEDLVEEPKNASLREFQPASLQQPQSLLIGAFKFIFIPTPFRDNGSFFLNIQSYESFGWYFFYLISILLLVGLLRRQYTINLLSISSTLFTFGFVFLSTLIEINHGTAVRHRSVFLIGVLIMLASYQGKKPRRIHG